MPLTDQAEKIATRAHHKLTKRAVIYRRGGVEIPIEASPLSVGQTVERSEGAKIRQRVPHWLLLPETLDFGDGQTQPRLGDQIIDGTTVYEVRQNASGEPWEWETPAQLRFKVITVMV